MKPLILISLFAYAFSAGAETYTWTNNVAQSGSWTNDVENWVDSEGNHPFEKGVGPAGTDANVSFVQMATSAYAIQTVNWDGLPLMSGSTWIWPTQYLGSVTYESPYPHRIFNIANANSSVLERGINVVIGDPTGFDGYWSTSYGQVNLILPATESFTPRLSCVSLAKRLDIEVHDSAAKAVVGDISSASGTLVKRGAGELEVNGTTGSDMQIHVRGGTVTLGGRVNSPEDGDDLPVAGAWLHLDSSRTNLMQMYTGDDGRLYVTNWPDVRGNGNGAYYNATWKRQETSSQAHLCPSTHAPFLNMDAMDGIPVMDFGTNTNRDDLLEALGPAWCMLDVSPRCTTVREAFFVGAAHAASVAFLGDASVHHFCRGGTAILSASYASKNLLNGTMFVNGELASPSSGTAPRYTLTDEFTPGVISMAATNNVTFGLLGSDRRYAAFSGGIRICEIAVFTNVLTHSQRMAIHRHLRRKWQKKEYLERVDVGAVTLAAGAAIGVKDGDTVTVAETTAVDGTLVKTGGGTLKVGVISSLDGSVPKIDVRGGSVEMVGLPAVDDTQPAADPYLWLDPNDYATRMTISNLTDNATNYVAEWYDHRPDHNDVYARLPPDSAADYEGVMPYIVTDATNGLAVVDFAEYGRGSKAAHMRLNKTISAANAYEAFLVQAYKTSGARAAAFFGNSAGVTLISGKSDMYLATDYGNNIGRNALWTFNGMRVDPVASGQAPFKVGEFAVGSVSLRTKQAFTTLGVKDRINNESQTSFGGVQMGEYLLYDRKLTPAERRQTIAYLMKRWLGRSPEYAKTEATEISGMYFPEGEAAVVETDVDMNVKGLFGFNGGLVKKGSGSTTVNAMACREFASISVEDGNLALDFTLSQAPAYDFDATKTSSLTTEEWTPEAYEGQPAADTVLRTNVTAWADANGNGVVASYDAALEFEENKDKQFMKRKPTLRKVATRNGVIRPMVDFGGMTGRYPGATNGDFGVKDSGALFFNKRFIDDDKLADFYTIFGDKHSNKPRQAMITDRSGNSFYRGDRNNELTHRLGALLDGVSAASACRNGFVSLDGEQVEVPTNKVINSGVHLVSFTPLSPQPVDTLGFCGNGYIVSGCRIGQQVAFKNALSEHERSKFLRYMMHKWFDEPWTFSTNTVDSISLNAGTTLTITGEYLPESISVRALGGSGEFVAANVNVKDVDTIDAVPEEGPFAVNGRVTFANAVNVNVALSEKPALEAYPIFTATELANVDLSAWTVNVQPTVALRRTRLVPRRNGDTIVLLVVRPGTVMTLR